MTDKVRMSLEVTRELYDILEQLSEDTGNSKSEVLRKAIGLMQVAVEAKQKGQDFGAADKGTPLRTKVVGL